jgi:mannitol/fructose-specific phosphotransferase system IIA component (Ntr-type)
MIAALGRSRVGVDWGAQDGGLTHLFLVLAVPEDCPGSHLKVLSNASRLLRDGECRQRIMQAPGRVGRSAGMIVKRSAVVNEWIVC